MPMENRRVLGVWEGRRACENSVSIRASGNPTRDPTENKQVLLHRYRVGRRLAATRIAVVDAGFRAYSPPQTLSISIPPNSAPPSRFAPTRSKPFAVAIWPGNGFRSWPVCAPCRTFELRCWRAASCHHGDCSSMMLLLRVKKK